MMSPGFDPEMSLLGCATATSVNQAPVLRAGSSSHVQVTGE